MKALVLSSSPRRNGNSALLAEAVRDGLAEAGHETQFVFADDFLTRLSSRLPEMPKAERRVLDRGRVSLRLSRSLSDGRRLHRRDADLLVRHLGPAQGLLGPHILLLRRVLSAVGSGDRRDDGETHRARTELRRDLPDGLRRGDLPDPGILSLHTLHLRRNRARLRQCSRRRIARPERSHRRGSPLWQGVFYEACQ